jgi:enoyl-CoA hydratase/carnithine racemase
MTRARKISEKGRAADTILEDGVLAITIRRRRLDPEAAVALVEACSESENDECRVVLLEASSRDFWRGLADPFEEWSGPDFVAALSRVTRPVVVALRGSVEDEGLELALAADLRVASPRTRFRMGSVERERIPRFGGTQRLPRIVGVERALRVLLLGEVVGASEAKSIGLVSDVDAQPASAARRLARNLASRGPVALRFAKEAVRRSADFTLDDGASFEHYLYALLHTTEDRREGIRAFLGKRPPRFQGR